MKIGSFNIINELHLNEIGLLEFLFALSPILWGFSIGNLPLQVLMWSILILVRLLKYGGGKVRIFMPLLIFSSYWILRKSVVFLSDDFNINSIIQQIIFFLAVFLLYPILNIKKLSGSMNWIAIISIIGLLYQWTDVAAGRMIHPLEIPGLDMTEERLTTLTLRPSSFFMEPAAYVAFMVCPLSFALLEKKIIWAITIIFSIFLTTSTTGIVGTFIVLFVYMILQGKNKKSLLLAIGVMAVLTYVLLNADIFSSGVEKLSTADTDSDIRLAQGPYIVSTMQNSELFLGVNFNSAYSYCISGRAPMVIFFGESVFVSTFWLMLLLYGIIGLVLYLRIYWCIGLKNRDTWPLIAYLLAVLFSSGYAIGSIYCFTLIILLVLCFGSKKLVI